MIIYELVTKLNIFIILNPFISMTIFIVIGIILNRLYLKLNPNYILYYKREVK
jgi:hypothetical protein